MSINQYRFNLKLLGLLGIISCSYGCLYDPDEKCSPGEVLERATCICPPNSVPELRIIQLLTEPDPKVRYGCTECGEREHPENGQCVCDLGYQRSTSFPSCTLVCTATVANSCPNGSVCCTVPNDTSTIDLCLDSCN